MAKEDLTAQSLRERLHYDPETGVFTYIGIRQRCIPGAVAGSKDNYGYRKHRIDGRFYRAHRLAWLYMYGVFPSGEVDHINGIRDDNKLSNLRDVPQQTNRENTRRPNKNNKSGYLGVASPCGGNRKFTAMIGSNHKRIPIGRFDTAEEAHQAYLQKKRVMHDGCTI